MKTSQLRLGLDRKYLDQIAVDKDQQNLAK